MKSLCITLCAMLFAVALFAQGTVIEVQGVAEYPREIDRYQADITI